MLQHNYLKDFEFFVREKTLGREVQLVGKVLRMQHACQQPEKIKITRLFCSDQSKLYDRFEEFLFEFPYSLNFVASDSWVAEIRREWKRV